MGAKQLVIQTAFLGDLLLTIPLIRNLRKLSPEFKIHLLCRKGFGDFFLKMKLVDQVFEVEKSSRESFRDVFSELQDIEYLRIICPHRSFRSAWMTRRLQAKERVGFRNFFSRFFFDQFQSYDLNLPESLRLLRLIEDQSIEIRSELERARTLFFDSPQLRNSLGSGEFCQMVSEISSMSFSRNELRTCLGEDRDLNVMLESFGLKIENRPFLLAPGSVWETKRWTMEGYAGVATQLMARGEVVVLIGSPEERILCHDISRRAPGVVNICGKPTVSELVVLMTYAKGLVCNDSGAMHLASLCELPTVAIFGPTTLDLGYRPWQRRAIVVQEDLACRPCGKHGSKTCPLGTHACMKYIGVERVLDAVEDLLLEEV